MGPINSSVYFGAVNPSLIFWPSITLLYISARNSPKRGGPLPRYTPSRILKGYS